MHANPLRWALLGVAAALLLLYSVAAAAQEASSAALPGDSLYQIELPLTDQTGRQFAFASLRGRTQLVSMFYTSCRYVCPLIIDTLKHTEAALDEVQRARLGVVVVSFDPARDDVEALASVAAKRRLDAARWHLARTDEDHVRTLAAALDIQYRRLDDGEFNHASRVILLDRDGRVLASTGKLGEADPAFVEAVRKALAAP
ncbi:MAG TPA: SCO family protein [Rhodanobacteraceae bacterium]|nr:SCO family protein [Rhodanobacteraceae bacterium]